MKFDIINRNLKKKLNSKTNGKQAFLHCQKIDLKKYDEKHTKN